MPGKVSKAGGKPTQTIAAGKASAGGSSRTSGNSKASSNSSVKKPATTTSTSKPTPPPKLRNVDKVDFGKTKTVADAGVYHRPKPIAAATGRDPAPPKPKSNPKKPLTFADYKTQTRIDERARKQLEAEKKARTEETAKAKLKTTITVASALAGTAIGGLSGTLVGIGVDGAREISDAKAHDKGEMTTIEKTIYEDNLYEHAHLGMGMSLKGTDDYWFDTLHKESIEQRKEEIKAEEEDENK